MFYLAQVRCEADGSLVLSSIFDWYAADFGASQAALLAHLGSFASGPLKASEIFLLSAFLPTNPRVAKRDVLVPKRVLRTEVKRSTIKCAESVFTPQAKVSLKRFAVNRF